MRDLLTKRIRERREKDTHIFGNYLIDYADVFAAISVLITFRIIVLLTLVYLCPTDYLIFWFGYHEGNTPTYWGFLTAYGLAAVWLIAKMIKDAQLSRKALWINRTVRTSLVVFLFFHAMFVPSMIIGYDLSEDMPLQYNGYTDQLWLESSEYIRFVDGDRDFHKRWEAY